MAVVKRFAVSLLCLFVVAVFSADGAKYVGSKKCMMCHKGASQGDQYGKWLASPHAKAFETLKSDKSKEVAKKLGIADPLKADQCLICHVTGHASPASARAEGFDATAEGVGCEACHGPGSLYKSMSVMRALREGRQDPKQVAFENGKESCLRCHNEKSPTYRPFDYAVQWPKIAHMIPKN
ncbi:MAG: cytochrome c family protein [candidate division KSB1 bacterium]|nr:cytochrome c family protein [candidate division KSB1 bacterium]